MKRVRRTARRATKRVRRTVRRTYANNTKNNAATTRARRPKGARVGLGLSGSRRQLQLEAPAHLKPLVSGIYKVRLTVSTVPETQTGPKKTLFNIVVRDLVNRF